MARYKSGEEAMVGDVVNNDSLGERTVLGLDDDGDPVFSFNSVGNKSEYDFARNCTLVRLAAQPDAERPTDRDAARYELTIDGKPVRLEAIIAACLSQERTGLTHADAGFLAHCWKYLFRMGLKSHAIHDARKLHDWTGKLVKLMESEKSGGVWVDTTEASE